MKNNEKHGNRDTNVNENLHVIKYFKEVFRQAYVVLLTINIYNASMHAMNWNW